MRPLSRGEETASRVFWALFLFCFLSMPALAYADAAVPMLFLTFPSMLVALIPIIFIEAAVYSRLLRIKYKRAVVPSAVANLASTFIGIPLAWVINVIVEAVVVLLLLGFDKLGMPTKWAGGFSGHVMEAVLSGGFMLPPFSHEVARWYPIGAMVGLIPAYFISVFIEEWIVSRFFNETDEAEIWKAVRKANKLTYALFFIVLAIFLYCAVSFPTSFNFFFWLR